MPIRPPALDDRSFDDLVTDLIARIPSHTPEWKDPQPGDPGRTLLELFAWLGDTILYRANLIPERQRLAFLRLLDLPLRPAQPARGLISIASAEKGPVPAVTFPVLSRIDQPFPFETLSEVTLLPVDSQCYIKRRPTSFEQGQLGGLLPDLQRLYQIPSRAQGYVTTPVFTSGADMAGIDIAQQAVDGCLWLALLAADPDPVTVAAARAQLGGGADNRGEVVNVGIAPAVRTAQFYEEIGVRAPLPIVWEICTGRGDGNEYLPLRVLSDTSRGVTQTGVVRLALPGVDDIGAPENDVTAHYRAGVGDRPPRIDDPLTAGRLVGWLRARPRKPGAIGSMAISWAGTNAVEIEQRRSFGRQTVGRGTGASGQKFSLGQTSIDPATLVVQVEEETGLQTWRQVPEIGATARGERAYALDSEAGTIRFGNGVNGKVPGEGRAVQVAMMRSGGGIRGNLPAGSITKLANIPGLPKVKVTQPLPLAGGTDAETIAQAEARIPATLRHRERAVTRTDYAELAATTPGVQVGRVEVIERFKPHQRLENMPGAVSVMAIPPSNRAQAPAPRPDRPLLESVYRWLDRRRPLSTELYVVGTDYVPIGISVAVEITDSDRREAILDAVTATVHRLLWPLPPGGAEGRGWPLGGTVDERLVESIVSRVPGVFTVAPVKLFRRDAEGGWLPVAADLAGRRTITLESWQLPELVSLGVGEGSEASDRLPDTGLADVAGGDAVPVPVVPEHC
ncbi:putative baseplate assembly protein [Qipengyuania sp.]|uniref:putative baseplate assembly protein n=1 Tax=Qipengyuania sp. TaxID=2004515 RepID=UPI003AF6B36B